MRTVSSEDAEGNPQTIVMGRSGEVRIVNPADRNVVLISNNVPYGAFLRVKDGDMVKKGDDICAWDPYNAVILSELTGTLNFDAIEDGITYREEFDEQTGFQEKVIIETRDKAKNPAIVVQGTTTLTLHLPDNDGGPLQKSYNLPVGSRLVVKEGQKIKAGQPLAKIPRKWVKPATLRVVCHG